MLPVFIEQVLYLYDLFHNIFHQTKAVCLAHRFVCNMYLCRYKLAQSVFKVLCVCVWTDVCNTGFNLVLSYEMFSGSNYSMQQTVCVSSNLKAFLKARDLLVWTTLPHQNRICIWWTCSTWEKTCDVHLLRTWKRTVHTVRQQTDNLIPLLLNADFRMLFKADSTTITELEAQQ